MRRRLATLALTSVFSLLLVLPAAAAPATAADAPSASVLTLAASGVQSTEGPEPRDADNTENEFAPAQYQRNWTANAGVVLFGLILLVTVLIGFGYWFRVARFARETRQS